MEQEQNELDELSALLDLDSTFSPDEQITRQETLSLAKSEKSVDILRTSNKLKTLLEVNIFEQSNNLSNEAVKKVPSLSQAFKKDAKENKHKISEIHNGDTDSSDDEDHKYAADQKYSETGRSIKNLLKKQTSDKYTNSASWKTHKSLFAPSESASGAKLSKDVYTDPYFGIRIVTPLISSQVLKERMQGKIPVTFTRLQNHLTTLDKSKDWVLAGVIVSKLVKTSQKGNPYVCWTLSDLREGLQTVSVFLFGKAYKNLWKTSTHIVVAILNPTQLENRKSSNDIAALSVLNSDQVMIWGKSKDLGTCKARKKNGEPCAVFVNVNQCDFCIYHVKQEYRKFTGRSELQAPSGGSLTKLKNKVLGKNEVFYAGKSYTASLAKPTKKQKMKDQKRLFQLFQDVNGEVQVGHRKGSTTQVAKAAPSARVQLMKDAERLQKQTGSPATVTSLALGVNNGSKNSKISTEEKKLWKSFGIGSSESETESQTSCSVSKSHREEQVCLKSTHENENENKTIISNRTVGNKKIACQQIFNIEGTKLSKSKSKNPTKNRFENLTKMKSIQCKTDESKLHSDIAKNQTFKGSVALQSQPNVDVCFEFEDYVKKNTLTALQLENSTIMSKNTHNAHSVRIPKLLKFTPPSHTRQTKTEKTGTSSVKKLLPMFIADVEKSPTLQKSLIDNNNERLLKPSVIKSKHITDQKDLTLEAPTPRLLYQKTPILSELGRTSSSIPARQSTAKLKALRYVQQKGPILKGSEKECKRKRSNFEDEINAICETSALSNRFIELMNVTSKHTDLISNAENQALEDYYDKMEKKEKMEEKMMTTYKIDCKAVRCLKCNYKWFSASEKCKEENHPIKVITAVKRFFQCQNCKNRTVTLEIIPLHNCTNCGRGNWIRAPMMRERTTSNVHLSIRGGEQKFSNSVVTDTNLDLLVPDDM